jgi:hypothetical protein
VGLRLGCLLACSINTRGGARGDTHAYTTPRENPSNHLLSVEPQNPSCARDANTPTRGVLFLYVWTPWRRCYGCCCGDQLRRCGGSCWDDYEEETIVIDYFIYTDTRLHWITAPTLLLLHCASSGNDP